MKEGNEKEFLANGADIIHHISPHQVSGTQLFITANYLDTKF